MRQQRGVAVVDAGGDRGCRGQAGQGRHLRRDRAQHFCRAARCCDAAGQAQPVHQGRQPPLSRVPQVGMAADGRHIGGAFAGQPEPPVLRPHHEAGHPVAKGRVTVKLPVHLGTDVQAAGQARRSGLGETGADRIIGCSHRIRAVVFIVQYRGGQRALSRQQRRRGAMRGDRYCVDPLRRVQVAQTVRQEPPQPIRVEMRVRRAWQHPVGLRGDGDLGAGRQIDQRNLGIGLADVEDRDTGDHGR